MLDELAIYRNMALQKIDAQRGDDLYNRWHRRIDTASLEEMEGYIIFGGGAEEVKEEPETNKPF